MRESRTLGAAELTVNAARAWAEVACKWPPAGLSRRQRKAAERQLLSKAVGAPDSNHLSRIGFSRPVRLAARGHARSRFARTRDRADQNRANVAPPRRILSSIATDRSAYGRPSARHCRGIEHGRPRRHPIAEAGHPGQRKRHDTMAAIEPRLAAFARVGERGCGHPRGREMAANRHQWACGTQRERILFVHRLCKIESRCFAAQVVRRAAKKGPANVDKKAK
jgi:hypothetical protein